MKQYGGVDGLAPGQWGHPSMYVLFFDTSEQSHGLLVLGHPAYLQTHDLSFDLFKRSFDGFLNRLTKKLLEFLLRQARRAVHTTMYKFVQIYNRG
jgi:hypothetical protein